MFFLGTLELLTQPLDRPNLAIVLGLVRQIVKPLDRQIIYICVTGFKYQNHLSFGITTEKDAGETFLGNSQAENLFDLQRPKGFDFYSAHFFFKGKLVKLMF